MLALLYHSHCVEKYWSADPLNRPEHVINEIKKKDLIRMASDILTPQKSSLTPYRLLFLWGQHCTLHQSDAEFTGTRFHVGIKEKLFMLVTQMNCLSRSLFASVILLLFEMCWNHFTVEAITGSLLHLHSPQVLSVLKVRFPKML